MKDRPRAADLVRRAMGAAARSRPVTFVRSRRPLVATAACAALVVALGAPRPPRADEASIAAMLAEATASDVAPADVVWEPSRGAAIDLAWGRGVAFLASTGAGEGAPRRDVRRARVTVAPGGLPLRVRAVTTLTETPLADEHDLVARGARLAWITRGVGGEHGATVLSPVPRTRAAAIVDAVAGPGLPGHEIVHVVLAAPVPELRAELRDEGLVLALRGEEGRAAALVDPAARTAQAEDGAPRIAVVSAPRAPSWLDGLLAASVPARAEAEAPEGLALAADVSFPPRGPSWVPLVAGAVPVPGAAPPPAPVVRAVIAEGQDRVVVHAFDLRQLGSRVVPAVSAPIARSGLPGSGTLRAEDAAIAVAAVPAIPLRDGGAREEGREIAPFGDGPTIASDAAGVLTLGPAAGAAPSAIELPDPDAGAAGGGAPAAAWCQGAGPALLHATARRGDRAAIQRALEPLGCSGPVWVADPAGAAAPVVGAIEPSPRAAPFAAFVRRRAFPDGRPETWTASAGRQPAPIFRPAVLETTMEVLGTSVRIVAFAGGRMGWAIRAGTGERSHRMGGTFPESLGPLRPRVVAAVGLGIGQRRRPNGLTIGGSTGHRYASRGAVLLAGDDLRLVRSSDARGDPPGDATELPLTAEGGELTAAARDRGLLHDRADLCVLPDGTVLVSIARFDSHEASAEALLRLGCGDVVGLDRGVDHPAVLVRPEAELPDDRFGGTVLLALEAGPP